MFLHSSPVPRERQSEWRGIFDFTLRETSFINFGGYTTVKKVAWLAWLRENVDSIPNNMILMSWKIPGPLEDGPDATVMRKRYCFIEFRLPSLFLTRGKIYNLTIKRILGDMKRKTILERIYL